MLKSLVTRRVCIATPSWFHNFNGVQNDFSRHSEQDQKKEDEEPPHSYKSVNGCPHSWFERIGLVTTAFVVGLNLKTRKTCESQRLTIDDDDDQRPKRCYCPVSGILSRCLLYAKPGGILTVLPEKGNSELRITKTPSSSQTKKQSSNIDQLIDHLEAGALEYTNELNNVIAMAYLQNGEIPKAIKLLQSCTTSAKAMFNLGVIFETGKHDLLNRAPDYKQALKYYEVSSCLGHKLATYNLALIYLYGKGQIESNEKKANDLLIKAAEFGMEEAKSYVEANILKDASKSSSNDGKKIDSATAKVKESKMTPSSSAPNLRNLFSFKKSDEARRKIFAHESRCERNFGSNSSLEVCFVN